MYFGQYNKRDANVTHSLQWHYFFDFVYIIAKFHVGRAAFLEADLLFHTGEESV